MAPTESTILENYLLLPARLPTIISLQEFTSYFPKSQHSSPQIRSLYRDLQQQRIAVTDAVASNIDQQVKQGKALRRAVATARREAEAEEGVDDELEIERSVSHLYLSRELYKNILDGGQRLTMALPTALRT
jgi:centromere-localized protein 2